ncbi:cytochrome c-type biogenesis protein CcmI [Beggiatoa alba B18LD]|uniref:Cytochrome c-type biogenesis protein CcmI n=1 Tax=Beggiatoa alba B18LD TaxID=395493 RepID=I3CI04_9GAMM|nr:c-type cytochrome biogenesis protein CcmI [Beggiatoa alba]EIJ43247.1 cytochrome c-type biogenesis protein CcmI [Beggiatoa alba B18LD]
MLTFWISASLLTLLALAFVIPPFFRRTSLPSETQSINAMNVAIYKEKCRDIDADETLSVAQKEIAKQELQKTLSTELKSGSQAMMQARARWASVIVLLFVPLLATGLYYEFGTPDLIEPPAKAENPMMSEKMAEFPQMVEKLAKKMQDNPDDPVGWQMLGRSYMVLQRYQDAIPAFNQVIRLKGEQDAGALVDLAEAMAMANNEQLTGQPSELLDKALAFEPTHIKALWLSGLAMAQLGDYRKAIERWESLLAQLKPEEAEDRQIIEKHIAQARELLQSEGMSSVPAESASSRNSNNTAAVQLSVNVQLADSLKTQLPANATLFIYARPAQGGRMPLAIVRKQASELPINNVILDDTTSAMPTMKLSSAQSVVVFARISASGNAMPQMGDLMGESSTLSLPHVEPIQIMIDKVVK